MEKGKLYSIGKIAYLMGISVQTLRFYEKIGLFAPSYVNPETGYRYYEYTQMHKIDRIRYLQKLGVPLEKIAEIYQENTVEAMTQALQAQLEQKKDELRKIQSQIEDLSWYLDYWTFLDRKRYVGVMYTQYLERRYALVSPMGDVPFSISNEWVYDLRNQPQYQDLECRRQYVSILDDEQMRRGHTFTLQYGLYLKKDPGRRDRHLIELPEGEYLCFLARIYDESQWSPEIFEKFLEQDKRYLVIANEYEDNLQQFDKCMYEIQIKEL